MYCPKGWRNVYLLPLGEGGAQRRMRGLVVRVWHAGTTTSGRNPLIRPSGTFSRREKEMKPQLLFNIETCNN